MKAAYLDNKTPFEEVKVGSVRAPKCGPMDILVRTQYAALNRLDFWATDVKEGEITKFIVKETREEINKVKIMERKSNKTSIANIDLNSVPNIETDLSKISMLGGDIDIAPRIEGSSDGISSLGMEIEKIPIEEEFIEKTPEFEGEIDKISFREEEMSKNKRKNKKDDIFPLILGIDGAGEVIKTGKYVKKIQKGEKVVIYPGIGCGRCEMCVSGKQILCKDYKIKGIDTKGTFAGVISVPVTNVLKIENDFPIEKAAAAPFSYTAAWRMLTKMVPVKRGDFVFVENGTEDIGTCAIQIAKYMGAKVITTTHSKENIKILLEKVGADKVFIPNPNDKHDYLEMTNLFTQGHGIDIAVGTFDNIDDARKTLRTLTPKGKLIINPYEFRKLADVEQNAVFWKQLVIWNNPTVCNLEDFFEVMKLVFDGKLKVFIAEKEGKKKKKRSEKGSKYWMIYNLKEVQKAEYMRLEKPFGKILLKIK